ncbi:MAG: hypothetical protein ACYCXA_07435 [Actinomycetes bacterium]
MIARMWEVRAADHEAAEAVVDWVHATLLPAAEAYPGYDHAQVFESATARVVVISYWRGEPEQLPEPPEHLVARPGASWDFVEILR